MNRKRGERGYAMVAAVAAMALLATMSLTLIGATGTKTAMARAERGRAQAQAATQAGFALALDGLLAKDRANRWSIDGRTRDATFAGTRLRIRVEDERGKALLDRLDEEGALRVAAGAGLSGERARIAAASLLDWIDDDDDPRENGAESEYYAPRAMRARNLGLLTIDELTSIRGFDAAAVERLRPFVTLRYGRGGFDRSHATPQAIAIMMPGGADSADAIVRGRELSGQQTAIELAGAEDLTGRPLSVHVEAVTRDGARSERRWLIELSGERDRPYVVRSVD